MTLVPLGEVAEILMGQSPPGESYNTDAIGLPFFQGKTDFGEICPSVRVYCTDPKRIAEPNDILLSVRAPVGPTNLAATRSAIGRGLSIIRTKQGTDYKYLHYFFRFYEPTIAKQGKGSTFAAIGRDDLESIRIPLPPLPEQHRIAALLDRADRLRRTRRYAQQLSDSFLQAVFVRMFPDNYNKYTIEEIAKNEKGALVNGPFGSNLLTTELVTTGIPVIYIRDISHGTYKRVSKSCVTPEKAKQLAVYNVISGDVLIAKVGDPPGTAAIYPYNEPRGIISQDVIRLRLNPSLVEATFLTTFLNSKMGFNALHPIIVEGTRERFGLTLYNSPYAVCRKNKVNCGYETSRLT